MRGKGFTFKQFHINHSRCAMKVGTDGVLLGAWCECGSAQRIADIGTVSLLVTIAGVLGALAIWQVALRLNARFLFERPDAFWIAPKKAGVRLQAAE